jgi:hypothetical protein
MKGMRKKFLFSIIFCFLSLVFSQELRSFSSLLTQEVILRRVKDVGLIDALRGIGINVEEGRRAWDYIWGYEDEDGFHKGEFRQKIEGFLSIKDIVEDQRITEAFRGKPEEEFQQKAEELAKQALVAMLRKLYADGVDINNMTQQEFNRILGVRLIIFAGGYAQRYSPTGLINKTVARATQEESNLRLAYNGAFKTAGLAPVIIIDDMVLQAVLKDQYLNPESFSRVKNNLLHGGRTGDLNGFIINDTLKEGFP